MPRKQRFKPSRKPSSTPQPPPPSPGASESRNEIHPDDVDVERDAPSRSAVLAEDANEGAEPDSSR